MQHCPSMKIIVTGSTGFIGSFVSKALSFFGDVDLTCINRTQENDYLGILNKEYLRNALKGCDGILHFAGISSVGDAERDPQMNWALNVDGTKLLIETLSDLNVSPWFVFPSSREVYGQADQFPVSESSKLYPKNHYGRSKLARESILKEAAKDLSLNLSILRFSSVYGSANDKPSRVIPSFCHKALNAKTMICNGEDNTLDFIHIQDVFIAIIKVMYGMQRGKKFPPLNIMAGRAIKLGDVARLINEICGNHSEIIYKNPRIHIHIFLLDVTRERRNISNGHHKFNFKKEFIT